MHDRRHWRYNAAVLVLCLAALGPLLGMRPLPTWTAAFHQARCVGPCCLVADGFLELSCGEYNPPAPATTAGAPASRSAASASTASVP